MTTATVLEEHSSSSPSSLARRRALADALSGVIASLLSLWAFYPVDVYKTHLQATATTTQQDNNKDDVGSTTSSPSTPATSSSSSMFVRNYFRGLHIKSLHTIASSFCYFYLESWMTQRYIEFKKRHQQRRKSQQQEQTIASSLEAMKPLEHLLLSALAAMANTLLTLPLDVISLQSQAIRGETIATSSSNNACSHTGGDDTLLDHHASIEDDNAPANYSTIASQRMAAQSHHNRRIASITNAPVSSSVSTIPSTSKPHQCEANGGTQSTKTDTSMFRQMDVLWNSIHDIDDDDDEYLDKDECSRGTASSNASEHYYDCASSFNTVMPMATNPDDGNGDDQVGKDDRQEEEKKDDFCISGSSMDLAPNTPKSVITARYTFYHARTPSSNNSIRKDSRFSSFISLWSGLVPSLLLCSNPSINYTVYDLLKSHLLQRKQRLHRPPQQSSYSSSSSSSSSSRSKLDFIVKHLTWAESFGIGMIAKLLATIATYPLIRAKVLLITNHTGTKSSKTAFTLSSSSPSDTRRNGNTCSHSFPSHADSDLNKISKTPTIPMTSTIDDARNNNNNNNDLESHGLMHCLTEQYQNYGLRGLYRGCSIQILHTVLKSALIMMIREQISDWVRRRLVG